MKPISYISDSQESSNDDNQGITKLESSLFLRISSAAFYGTASFMITVINKRILTVYKFPSFQVSLYETKFLDTH